MNVENKEIMKKMMFCPYCGVKLEVDARFCKNCGAEVGNSSEELERQKKELQIQLEQEKIAREVAEENYRKEAAKNIINHASMMEENDLVKNEKNSGPKMKGIMFAIVGIFLLIGVAFVIFNDGDNDEVASQNGHNDEVFLDESDDETNDEVNESDSWEEKTNESFVLENTEAEIKIEPNEYLSVSDFGWYISGGEYLSCVVEIKNMSEKAIELPAFRVTAYDDNNAVMGTSEQILSVIYPKQSFVCDYLLFEVSEKPSTFVVTVLEPDEYNIIDVTMLEHEVYKEMESVNVSIKNDMLTGEIYNPNDYKIDSALITVVFRNEDGVIVNGEIAFVDQIPAGGKVPFSVYLYFDDVVPPDYEVYAYVW